jgi:adenylate cyclase
VPWAEIARPLDLLAADATFALWRRLHPPHAARDIVIVGLDEATLAAAPEPLALFHRQLGQLLEVLATNRPRAIALDLVLPVRSYETIAPGYDLALLRGILAARRAGIIVLARTIDDNGDIRPVLPPILAAAGSQGSAFSLLPVDPDGLVRRVDERIGADGAQVATLAGVLARRLGKTEIRAGWMDFAQPLGVAPLSMQALLAPPDDGDDTKLRRAVEGKVVFIGALLPFLDRHPVPTALAGDLFPPTSTPGVYVQAQALHTLLNGTSRPELPAMAWLSSALLAAVAWRGATTWQAAMAVVVAGGATLVGLSVAMLALGFVVPVVSAMVALLASAGLRFALQVQGEIQARRHLRRIFSGYVSPTVLAELEAGRLDGMASSRRFLCVMFLDVRGFTGRSEADTPEHVTATLNLLFETATRVIHQHGGTVKEFMGDGVMALFGAPGELPDPAQAGFDAARDMLAALPMVNAALRDLGLAPIEIGIGLSCGEAIVGHIGSAARHAYGAVGDCVNVASRLEGLTQALGTPLLLSAAVRELVRDDGRIVSLGRHAIKGHTPVEVHGWK